MILDELTNRWQKITGYCSMETWGKHYLLGELPVSGISREEIQLNLMHHFKFFRLFDELCFSSLKLKENSYRN